ncbi:amino acid/polyamine transporter I [Obelidium mucronatum]|nr:amino acid/polyamine transporter I [Obelidium mucronatum]
MADEAADAFKSLVKLKHKTYLTNRKLMEPYAKSVHVWGLIVGAVISGEFAGFNQGYKYGLGSMITAHVFASLLMVLVSVNLLELTTTLPFASGSATFAKAAYGGGVGFTIGLAYLFDMVFFGAEASQFFAVALQQSLNTDTAFNCVYWIMGTLICFVINVHPKVFFNTITMLSFISVVILLAVVFATSSNFSFQKSWETVMPSGAISTDFLPFGIWGVIQSFPYALYLIVCFECLPVSVEEVQDSNSTLLRGMTAAVSTLIFLSWISLTLTAGIPPFLHNAPMPFSTILVTAYPQISNEVSSLINIIPVFSSQVALFYAASRFTYGLSRAGYIPQILSRTNVYGAPYISMLLVALIWISFGLVLTFAKDTGESQIFLAIGSMFAMIAYIVEPLVYIKLKFSIKIHRPFQTHTLVGCSFAVICLAISSMALVGKLVCDRFWQWGFLGVAWVLCWDNSLL